jgi:4-amino-4-deoxy-L-arabinose transferase-like glycosyltransferase
MLAPTAVTSARWRVGSTAGLLLILLLAGALRFWGIGAESLWLDEATSLVVADNPPATIVALTAEDIHPPLYYLLLHLWLIFGRSEAALRSLSAVVGVLSVAALYGMGRELLGERPAALGALLLASAPLHIWYSQEARMYALVTLWAVLASWLMVRALRKGGWWWAGYVLCTAAGMYTHYYMGFVALAQNAFAAYLLVRRRLTGRRVGHWLLAQLAWILLFAPWLPVVVRQIQGGGGAWVGYAVGRPGLATMADTFIGFTIGPARAEVPVLVRRAAYLLYVLALALAGWRLARRRPAEAPEVLDGAVLGALWFALPLATAWLASQVKPLYSLRYALPFLPPFCLLAAWGVDVVIPRHKAAGLLLAGALLASNLAGTAVMAELPQKPDWRQLTATLIAEAQAGDLVVPEPFWNAKPLRYYAGGRLAVYDLAPLPATPEEVQRCVEELGIVERRIWLVEDVGHYGDPDRLLYQALMKRGRRVQSFRAAGIGEITLFELSR